MLLEAIISLGRKLQVTLLAEGIETQRQLRKLLRLGCKFGQGYLFSHAVAADDLTNLFVGGALDSVANLRVVTAPK
jgi:EAL domain-containing protein (putative c-di-GMP-specific phosphodiesterase class I)